MNKIFQLLGLPAAVKGDVGVEIEAEGENLAEIYNDYWRTTDDGSLRGRYPTSRAEFVIQNPIPVYNVKKAVINLIECLPKNHKFDFSYRTSVHVHVNVQHLTENQVSNLIYTYALVENTLLNYAGKSRQNNRFCLRIQDADGIIDLYEAFIIKGFSVFDREYNKGQIKYSALNLYSMREHGSVEFRSLAGCADPDRIHNWCNALVRIRDYAANKNSIQEIADEFVRLGSRKFIKNILGDLFKVFDYLQLGNEAMLGFSLSAPLLVANTRKDNIPKMDDFADVAINAFNLNVPLINPRVRAIDDLNPLQKLKISYPRNSNIDRFVERINDNKEIYGISWVDDEEYYDCEKLNIHINWQTSSNEEGTFLSSRHGQDLKILQDDEMLDILETYGNECARLEGQGHVVRFVKTRGWLIESPDTIITFMLDIKERRWVPIFILENGGEG